MRHTSLPVLFVSCKSCSAKKKRRKRMNERHSKEELAIKAENRRLLRSGK